MTSIRVGIALEVASRLSQIAGWNVQMRKRQQENPGNASVRAIVFQAAEDKRIENNEQYDATLSIAVEITVHGEDANNDPLPGGDDGNPYLYLDRMVTLAEKKVHNPDDWSLVGSMRNWIDGHDVSDPSDDNEYSALLRLTFKYRHHYQDPEV